MTAILTEANEIYMEECNDVRNLFENVNAHEVVEQNLRAALALTDG
jgi:hypothetical protein